MNRRFEQLDATGLRHSAETGSKLAIVITDQILGYLPIRRRFSQLLGHPGIRWASSHAHVDHLARLEFYDEEREERSKEQISHLQEVAGPDLSGVVTQKGRPLLTAWLGSANSSHVFGRYVFIHAGPVSIIPPECFQRPRVGWS